jgi:hypothetical protein
MREERRLQRTMDHKSGIAFDRCRIGRIIVDPVALKVIAE